MLNDIRLHLDADEEAQSKIEHSLSGAINTLQEKNVKAFNQFVPTIGKVLSQLPFDRLSMFVDQHEQFNLVDFKTGATLYTPYVDDNINAQLTSWAYTSALLDLSSSTAPILSCNEGQQHDFACRQQYAASLQKTCEQTPIDSLVVLGLGKATHIEALLSACFQSAGLNHADEVATALPAAISPTFPSATLKHIIIYEPDWEVFRCTLSIFDWASLLNNAQNVGLQVFLQIGTDPQQIYDEITELHQQVSANRIVFYKHINSPLFMHLVNSIAQGNWGRSAAQLPTQALSHHFHHLHAFSAAPAHAYEQVSALDAQFCSNMALFEEYFPDIYSSFSDYQPQCWQTLKDSHTSAINLFNTHHGHFFANSHPQKEGELLARHFAKHPHLDGLVFGYEGDKLRHYLHNTFIRQADMILRESEESKGELPSRVKVLMMFGLGNGYMLEALYKSGTKHDIDNLIVCEPNPDMFYASLHAIDWAPIFARVNEGEHKLYINIGESSSLLFRDIMSQFMALGPHLLNETYIAQAYHNPMLHSVMSEVRQQLKVIFAMGENFDHVAYGIAHTAQAMQQKIPALRYQPSQYLSHLNKQTPVFLVGNGPSLDSSIALIKEYQGSAIVVSCGTALQALYKNGITPDFHGEVEQNRANFDWASRINDPAYLQQITLLSINGIHPDTCALYKNVLMAFKSGESSTHTMLAMFPEKTFHSLKNAYPTVTNMAMSFFLEMGFEQLYLIGVDLGFADQTKHHSSASGYYENGKQIFDYKSANNTNLRVKGNLQDWVFTKTEFNISRMIIEQMLSSIRSAKQGQHANAGGLMECFNISEGVYIEGTIPLTPESVLVVASSAQKQAALAALGHCFMAVSESVTDMLHASYQQKKFTKQVSALHKMCDVDIASKDNIDTIIEELNALLRKARQEGKSLFYYYFFNSINYLSAALSKAGLQADEALACTTASRLLSRWQVFLADTKPMLKQGFTLTDNADAFGDKREQFLLKNHAPVRLMCSSPSTLLALRSYLGSQQYDALVMPVNNPSDSANSQAAYTSELVSNTVTTPLIIVIQNQEDIVRYLPLISALTPSVAGSAEQGVGRSSITNATPNDIQQPACDDTQKTLYNDTANAVNNGFFKSPLPLGVLFHNYALLTIFEEQHPTLAEQLCLLYSPPLLTKQVEPGENSSITAHSASESNQEILVKNVNKGTQDCLLIDQYWHFIQARGQDLRRYSQVIAKPRFSPSGLAARPGGDAAKNIVNNEYNSVSVAAIDNNIVKNLPINQQGYMFKNYFAYPKHSAQPPAFSILDSLQNRGNLLHRCPLDFELLGPWHKTDDLQLSN